MQSSIPTPGSTRRSFARRLGGAFALAMLLTGALFGRVPAPATADNTVSLVKDIHPDGDSDPSQLVSVGGTLFLVADDGEHGPELWRSDGTTAGTRLVKDIRPGGTGSSPRSLTAFGGKLFFAANDGMHGYELWRSDGTAAGTTLVKDIYNANIIGDQGSHPNWLTVFKGALFFFALDANHGAELWRSDGTEAGTALFKDLLPGSNSASPLPHIYPANNLTISGGKLFFVARHSQHYYELWQSDGTTAGTSLVRNICPEDLLHLKSLTDVQGTLFFLANDIVHGQELWKSDGTAAGTVMVKDIIPGEEGVVASWLTNVNGTLFFAAGNYNSVMDLWKSNGTQAGTIMVADVDATGESWPFELTNVAGTLFFAITDANDRSQLWKSDGTTAGTGLVANLNTVPVANMNPYSLISFGRRLLFWANDGVHGVALWQSDGTKAGTAMAAGPPPENIGWPSPITLLNGTLFFSALDSANGRELWKIEPNLPLQPQVYLPGVVR